mgnify:CR=1 FL=1
MDKLPVNLLNPSLPHEMDMVRAIFREYAESLGIDLCFQDFENELAQLPGEYAAPRGHLLLAEVDGAIAGCCALRPLDTADYPNAAEMKRLYVRKAFRGAEFLYTLRLADGLTLLAHVPSHHNHALGEWIGIRPDVDHVVTFARS